MGGGGDYERVLEPELHNFFLPLFWVPRWREIFEIYLEFDIHFNFFTIAVCYTNINDICVYFWICNYLKMDGGGIHRIQFLFMINFCFVCFRWVKLSYYFGETADTMKQAWRVSEGGNWESSLGIWKYQNGSIFFYHYSEGNFWMG